MTPYLTIAKEIETELVVQRSRFITALRSVETREEGEAFLRSIRETYPDATHHVPAMVVGPKRELQWTSDDGEPQGTAGPPILQLLSGMELTNLMVVVTRYFGGIKLGTGGLVRAYTQAAKDGIAAAGLARVQEMLVMTAGLDYGAYNRLLAYRFPFPVQMDQGLFDARVTVALTIEPSQEASLRDILGDLSGGTCEIMRQEMARKKVPIEG